MLIASGLAAGVSFGAAAATGDSLLSPTPLILKDGRIANVSVHVVVFAEGGSALESAIAQNLNALTDEVATDCFLTAQVIGHVGSSEVAGNDTLNAHRLARARADAVQASLIAGGLPANAIASVWDWQFMVRAARATLWVFRLTPGEDCEGTPLDAAAGALVAQAEPGAAPTRSPQEGAVGSAAPVVAMAARPSAPALSAGLAAKPALAETAQPVLPPAVAAVPAGPSPAPAQAPTITKALPAVSPAEAQPPARAADAKPAEIRAAAVRPAAAERAAAAPTENPPVAAKPAESRPQTEVAAAAPTENPSVAAKPAESRPEAKVAAATPGPAAAAPAQAQSAQRQAAVDVKEERLVIVFPTNSSYFPPGTGSQLRSLLRTLAKDRRYEVVLESSVSGSQKVVGAETAEDAAKYNQWLATRRLERVRDWLDQNATGRGLEIKPEYHANDESRQVVVRIRPTG